MAQSVLLVLVVVVVVLAMVSGSISWLVLVIIIVAANNSETGIMVYALSLLLCSFCIAWKAIQIPDLCLVWSNSNSLFSNIFTSSTINSHFSQNSTTVCNYFVYFYCSVRSLSAYMLESQLLLPLKNNYQWWRHLVNYMWSNCTYLPAW